MKDPKSFLVLPGVAAVYFLGLVFAIGIAARLGPMPSSYPMGSAMAYGLAVVAVAALVAPVLVTRFADKAFAAGLLVAAPCALEVLWSLSHMSGAIKSPLLVITNVISVALAPAAMTVVIKGLFRTAGLASAP